MATLSSAIYLGYVIIVKTMKPGEITFHLRFHGEIIFESPRRFRNARLALEAGLLEADRQHRAMLADQDAECEADIRAERPRNLG